MKDFPCFTCQDGMASLILREIPYRQQAYVVIRAVFGTLEGLLQDCLGFCRAAGAVEIFCSGDADLSVFPVHARLMERRLLRENLPETSAVARPTSDEDWLQLYLERFAAVPAAHSYTSVPEQARFIYDGEQRIGLGLLQNGELSAVASLVPHRGRDCVCALARELGEELVLLCAMENTRAMALYDRLGFSQGPLREIWYRLV